MLNYKILLLRTGCCLPSKPSNFLGHEADIYEDCRNHCSMKKQLSGHPTTGHCTVPLVFHILALNPRQEWLLFIIPYSRVIWAICTWSHRENQWGRISVLTYKYCSVIEMLWSRLNMSQWDVNSGWFKVIGFEAYFFVPRLRYSLKSDVPKINTLPLRYESCLLVLGCLCNS